MIENKPHTMFVRTTENCNADCFMCDFARLSGKPILSADQVDRIAIEASKSGVKLIRFTGGEPLLDKNLSQHIAKLKTQGFKTSIITNGYLLKRRASDLASAGLDQVIVSLDGSNAELHNKLRNTPKLFENATDGLSEIKRVKPDIVTRVNTVVSKHNLVDLSNIKNLLVQMSIDQWSIIPIKGTENHWKDEDELKLLSQYELFKAEIAETEVPRILGFSKTWAGRTSEEAKKYFSTGVSFTPREKCELVKRVRFYNPEANRLSSCNCVPWRLREVPFNTDVKLTGLNDDTLEPVINHLNVNGPKMCTGCEPINAYLAENPDILEEDTFAF